MSRHTSTSWHEDRGFGKYLEEAAVERTGRPEEAHEGAEETREERPAESVDTSRPPVTGRRGSRGNGFGRYLR